MIDKINHSKELIAKAISIYPNIAIASSFGKDSVVLIHLAQQIKPDIKIFSVMTPYKFKETRDYKDKLTKEWNLNITTYEASELGMLLYKKDIEQCCNYYKVEPTKRAIKELQLDAWITGLRNTEGGEMREKFTKEIETKEDGLVKVNPILSWTEKDIWLYHAVNSIPVHPLYLKGYRSLGCEPCSKICKDDSKPEREGRWVGTNKIECGIHCAKMMRD